jgi:hypothetical protein
MLVLTLGLVVLVFTGRSMVTFILAHPTLG